MRIFNATNMLVLGNEPDYVWCKQLEQTPVVVRYKVFYLTLRAFTGLKITLEGYSWFILDRTLDVDGFIVLDHTPEVNRFIILELTGVG